MDCFAYINGSNALPSHQESNEKNDKDICKGDQKPDNIVHQLLPPPPENPPPENPEDPENVLEPPPPVFLGGSICLM